VRSSDSAFTDGPLVVRFAPDMDSRTAVCLLRQLADYLSGEHDQIPF